MLLSLALVLALAPPSLASPGAAARGDELEHVVRDTAPSTGAEPARTYLSFRVGAATASPRPQLCLEVTPLELLGVEACGSGGGFLHNEPGTDISHFRGKVRLAAVDVEGAQLEPWLAAGFAELQVAGDVPGFDFNGTSAGAVSTAGPDVGASVRALLPLGGGFEIVGEAGVGIAFFSHARSLVIPQDPLQPQAQINLGVGF